MIQTQDEIARNLRTSVEEGSKLVGIDAEFVLRQGNPYRELIAVAAELRVDAVVIGASMQSGRRFVGSLAGRLVRLGARRGVLQPRLDALANLPSPERDCALRLCAAGERV